MKIFEKSEIKILWPFYLEYFIASLLYFAPIFWTFYFLDIGFSLFQVAIIFTASQIATLIFEIPTGSFADVYGRKISVIVGYIIEGICMISMFFAKDYSLILFLFILFGIGGTFSSGSKDAWIVDLINKKDKRLIHKFFNKQQFIIKTGLFFSGIIGAIVVKMFGINIIWIVTALSYIFSALILAFFTKEIYLSKKPKENRPLKNLIFQTKTSMTYSYKHPVLFWFFIAGIIFVFASMLQVDISWIPLLKELGLEGYSLGYLWSLMSLVMALAPVFALRFLKKGEERKFTILAITLGALTNIFIIFSYNLLYAIPVLVISLFFFHSKNPAQSVYFHRFVPSKLRATIGSIRSMIVSLASILALPVAGFLVDLIGPRYTILISSIIMIPVIIIYSRIKDEKINEIR